MDELRQGRIGDKRHDALAEIIIIQPEDAGIRSETKFMPAIGPREIVIDEEACRAPALHPGIVQTANGRKRSVGAAALQHDRECR